MLSQEEQWLLTDKYSGEKTEGFFADCARLKAGEPLAYIIGSIPFLNTTISLDSKPLIPRPETEYWVEKAIYEIQKPLLRTALGKGFRGQSSGRVKVLDLCAGSGCIGVAVLASVPVARVDFSEIDARHLPTIEKNINTNNITPERARIFESNLFKHIPSPRVTLELGEVSPRPDLGETKLSGYDFILTNPPYIDPQLDRTETSVKTFEPHRALYGGTAGMELIAQIVCQAKQYLNSNGQLWIEHEPEHTPAIVVLAESHGFAATTHKDQYDVERYSILVLQ